MQSEQDPSASRVPVAEPNPALRRLDFLVGEWRLDGRDDVSGGEIRGRLRFDWMDGGFYLVQHVDIDYAGKPVRGVEYIGHQGSTGRLRSYFFGNEGRGPSATSRSSTYGSLGRTRSRSGAAMSARRRTSRAM